MNLDLSGFPTLVLERTFLKETTKRDQEKGLISPFVPTVQEIISTVDKNEGINIIHKCPT